MPTYWLRGGMGVLLLVTAPVHAGLYCRLETPPVPPPSDFRQFRELLLSFWNLDNPQASPTPLRLRYQSLRELLSAGPPGVLSPNQRVDAGACFLRWRRYDEAIQILRAGQGEERDNFLLLANLATAYHLAGQEVQALDAVQSALAVWPAHWEEVPAVRRLALLLDWGWDEQRFAWYRRAEQYFARLLRLRLSESRGSPHGAASEVDDLFGVRFVSENGQYQAGRLAAAEQQKLPRDALALVQQLLLWLPGDLRLYGLLGELYNAQGEPAVALEIFDSLLAKGSGGPQLREHRRILQAHSQAAASPPGGVPLAGMPELAAEPSPAPAAPAAAGTLPLNPWQALGIGLLVGVLAGLLLAWQVRELRRRGRPSGSRS